MSTGHYSIARVESIDHLRQLFTDKTDYTLNWLFLSTSGVHGWYTTLDSLEARCTNPSEDDEEEDGELSITVLVVQARLVRVQYGHIKITVDDIPWLRAVVEKTLRGVQQSQQGNLPPPPPPE